jgi:hypothetical protein
MSENVGGAEGKKRYIPAHGGPLNVTACPLGACVAGTMLGEGPPRANPNM